MLCYAILKNLKSDLNKYAMNVIVLLFSSFYVISLDEKNSEKSYLFLAKNICQLFHNGAPKPADILLHWNVMTVQKNENIAYVNFVSSVSLNKAGFLSRRKEEE